MMINRIYTQKSRAVQSTSTCLFKLVAIMLIVEKYRKISISKLQVCLWGIQSKDNLEMISIWKKEQKITNAPWIVDNDITPLIMQCICNKLLKTEIKASKVSVMFDVKADRFINDLRNIDFCQSITEALNNMGNITDSLINNVEFDF